MTSTLGNPAAVGAHWFQCYDESTPGRADGENYQIGVLDICDTPYPETIAAAREVGYRLYSLRAEPLALLASVPPEQAAAMKKALSAQLSEPGTVASDVLLALSTVRP